MSPGEYTRSAGGIGVPEASTTSFLMSMELMQFVPSVPPLAPTSPTSVTTPGVSGLTRQISPGLFRNKKRFPAASNHEAPKLPFGIVLDTGTDVVVPSFGSTLYNTRLTTW